MTAKSPETAVSAGLRSRKSPLKLEISANGKGPVQNLPQMRDARDLEPAESAKEQLPTGRTPDGIAFVVPTTHDMVSQLLDPRQPKNVSDIVVLTILAAHVLLYRSLPLQSKKLVLALVFLFWRGCYDVVIGRLLHLQSRYRRMTRWAQRLALFEDPASGKNPRPWLFRFLKKELEAKIPENYRMETAPLEYNTWLVFRRAVDLTLMCDFVAYCLFAVACASRPAGEGLAMFLARWSTGIILIGFNLWVKLDAHRIVKDFGWYFGDYFFLLEQELTFDGVFEMAPHPMYSVGYAGYYGISLLSASYWVLLVSLIAHAAQFAFLVIVENPHIERTYNSPPPQKPFNVKHGQISGKPKGNHDERTAGEEIQAPADASKDDHGKSQSTIGFRGFDLHRVVDVAILVLIIYVTAFTIMTPSNTMMQILFVLHAVAWRLAYSLWLGIVLGQQSNFKTWTRHFVKWGGTTQEAWSQWKGVYRLTMTMCWMSFIAATIKLYTIPTDWEKGLVLLRHIMGAGLIMLQMWTTLSIYESLGETGYFFGDFFLAEEAKLTYNGIYRFLNNPERILGLAGVWGAVLITKSRAVFFLALLSHVATLATIQFVEKPHMDKLYGRKLRKEAGLTKTLRRAMPSQWHGKVDRVLGDTGYFIDEFFDTARTVFDTGVQAFGRNASASFKQYPTRISVRRLLTELAGVDPSDYSLEVVGTTVPEIVLGETSTAKESEAFRSPIVRYADDATQMADETLVFEYGAPITVNWTAPIDHDKKDWLGLYQVVDSATREATLVSSAGRWIPTNPNQYDSTSADLGIIHSDTPQPTVSDRVTGQVIFSGDKLWWSSGVYEIRYHHAGRHNVLAISHPFELRLRRRPDDADAPANPAALAAALLPVVQACLERDAPATSDAPFGPRVERDVRYARRIVYAVQQLYGIEFAPDVVLADGSVRRLAGRISEAKAALAPYVKSPSRGPASPVDERRA